MKRQIINFFLRKHNHILQEIFFFLCKDRSQIFSMQVQSHIIDQKEERPTRRSTTTTAMAGMSARARGRDCAIGGRTEGAASGREVRAQGRKGATERGRGRGRGVRGHGGGGRASGVEAEVKRKRGREE